MRQSMARPEPASDERNTFTRELPVSKIVVALVITGLVVGLMAYLYHKTLWDVLELLIVPAVLAIGGYLFTRSENRWTQHLADQRAQEDREAAEQRAQIDRDLAEQRAQDDALEAYMDQMGQLLLDKEELLRTADPDSGPIASVRARTLAALDRIDVSRKKGVLLFLYGSGLIGRTENIVPDDPEIMKELEDETKDAAERVEEVFQRLLAGARTVRRPAVIDLAGADLSELDLKGAYLPAIDLSGTIMNGADLSGAILDEQANLWSTALEGAHLSAATLSQATLNYANLANADLSAPLLLRMPT